MNAQIIAITNRKGGVGKSTMTAHLGAGLALAGLNVGIVDTDSQGHAGRMLGLPAEDGLYNVMINKLPLEQAVRLVDDARYVAEGRVKVGGNVYALPSSSLTYKIPLELQESDGFLFLETVEAMVTTWDLDVVLIDTNPTLSLFDGSVYLAADGFIYVTECEAMSLEGVQTAMTQMRKFGVQRERYLHRKSRVLGIIPNKLRANTAVHRQNIEALGKAYPGLVWPAVPLRTGWGEAANLHETVYRYAPNKTEARSAFQLVERMLEALR